MTITRILILLKFQSSLIFALLLVNRTKERNFDNREKKFFKSAEDMAEC